MSNYKNIILVINAGSSSIKFSLFAYDSCADHDVLQECQGGNSVLDAHSTVLVYHGSVNHILTTPQLHIVNNDGGIIEQRELATIGTDAVLGEVFLWVKTLTCNANCELIAIGHRVVHGGTLFSIPVLINDEVLTQLETLNPLAPLHQPHNITAIKIAAKYFPDISQVACFDTAFHITQMPLAKLFALPKHLTASGIIRYGFHGISYEYIATHMYKYFANVLQPNAKVIVAHLGNGASMCALLGGKSIDTSMGFTAVDGLMMGTRSGTLDPGVITYLLEERHYTVEQINHLLYNESGLLGVSGISNDVEKLLASDEADASLALDLFCYRAAKQFAALCVSLSGCDMLIFTAGIGEHAAPVRAKICAYLAYLGVTIDNSANSNNQAIISGKDSKILVGIMRTDEEYMLMYHTMHTLKL